MLFQFTVFFDQDSEEIEKKKNFLVVQFAPLDYSTNCSKNASDTKTIFKELGSKWNEEICFQETRLHFIKKIFNTVAICSFVCWVPFNLFSLDLQLLRDILRTETWFFQLKFAKCVYIFNWWLFTFVRNLKTLRSSTGLVKSSISNLVENLWSKIP